MENWAYTTCLSNFEKAIATSFLSCYLSEELQHVDDICVWTTAFRTYSTNSSIGR